MILDSFKINNAIIQVQYPEAFLLWDRAGEIGRQVSKIWPGIKVTEGQPQQQTLSGNGVSIQTGFSTSTITLSGELGFSQLNVRRVCDTVDVWRKTLEIETFNRVSTRVIYEKEFESLKKANDALFALNLVRWPTDKVFDQPMDSEQNGVEVNYRFEDDKSFSFLKLKADRRTYQVNLDPNLFDEPTISKTKSQMVIDYDRGLLAPLDAEKFRMDEWLKGYQHILRRDIEKVLK